MTKLPGLDTVKKFISKRYNPTIFFFSLSLVLTFSYPSKICLESDLDRNQRNTKYYCSIVSILFSCLGEGVRTNIWVLEGQSLKLCSFTLLSQLSSLSIL